MNDDIITGPMDIDPVEGTVIHWFKERMAMSGISKEWVDKCGITLHTDEVGAFFKIPYFTVEGIRTTFFRQRNRESRSVYESDQSSGKYKGKYTQNKGTTNRLYYPPVADQLALYTDVEKPILICEGELKSICAKIWALSNALDVCVAGVPGTILSNAVKTDLLSIPISGYDGLKRVVFIAMDWNGRGKSLEASREMEFQLTKLFQQRGATVILLRWDLIEGSGEQKLDDWIVSGGNLRDAMTLSMNSHKKRDSEIGAVLDYLNSKYAVLHGKFIPLDATDQKYDITDLNTMEGHMKVQVSAKKTLKPAAIWEDQPRSEKNIIDGYTFAPPPLGQFPEKYVWINGKRLINTAPTLDWEASPWATDPPLDVTPFINLLNRLCQDGAEWFLNFLAHCAQYPADRGSHIVIFKDEGGTGKSILFMTLDAVFGPYSGPTGDALSSSFNASIEKLIIAWWSDPVIHSGFDRDLESALKNFSGDSKITINHKGGAKYTVPCYGRLIIATNKDWIVPVNSKERRYAVFGGLEPFDHSEAGKYLAWLRDGGIQAIREALIYRDLSGFDIHENGPRTAQRIEMERLSATPLDRFLLGETLLNRDIWEVQRLRENYKDETGKTVSSEQVGVSAKRLNMPKRRIKTDGEPRTFLCLRNYAKWDSAPNTEWVAESKPGKYE